MSNTSFDFSNFLSGFTGGSGFDYNSIFSGSAFGTGGSNYSNFFSSGSYGAFGGGDTMSNLFGGGDGGIQDMFTTKLFGPDPIKESELSMARAELEELDSEIDDKEAEVAKLEEDVEYLEDQRDAALARASQRDGFLESIGTFLDGDDDAEDVVVAQSLLANANARLLAAEGELNALEAERAAKVTEIERINTEMIEDQDTRFSNLFTAWAASDDGDISGNIANVMAGGNGKFGGDFSGSVDEANDTIGGTLTSVDENDFVASTITGAYGTAVIGEDGAWTYDLDETNSDVIDLNNGETLRDTITVSSSDGSTQDISITIDGKFGGDNSGSVDETNDTIGGTLASSDDTDFVADTIAGAYGTAVIGADGAWTYDLDETNTDVINLTDGAKLRDTITVSSSDGTKQDIFITIDGDSSTTIP